MARLQQVAIPLADSLAAAISAGSYPVGSALPTLSQIERAEGCSRSTVQRALGLLAERGLVKPRHGAGFFVIGVPEFTQDAVPFKAAAAKSGHLYVLKFTSGVVKIGYTTDPKIRIRTHGTEARRRSDTLGRSWVSLPHPAAAAHEQHLLSFARSRFEPAFGAEFFQSADFDALVAHARLLLDEPSQPDLLDLLAA